MRVAQPLRPLTCLSLGLLMLLPACGGDDEPTTGDGGATVTVDTSVLCDTEAVVAGMSGTGEDGASEQESDEPVATAMSENPVLTRLSRALETAELTETLNDATALTIFAPVDCAFARVDEATFETALADPGGRLTEILGFHIIPGERLARADLTGGTVTTFTGAPLDYTTSGSDIVLDGQARIVVADLQAANATIHLVDTLMLPSGQAGGGVTATPPPSAGPQAACDPNALMAAIEAQGGEGTLAGMADDPVVTAAANSPVLHTFVNVLQAAGVAQQIEGAASLTLFAPTDCAFSRMDPSTLQALLSDSTGVLARVAGFHVVLDQRLAFDQLTGGQLQSLAGIPLNYSFADNVVTLNNQARIVVPNIQTANATMHLIDTVMLPGPAR